MSDVATNEEPYKPLLGYRYLADLVDFPGQSQLYPPLPEAEEIAFAEDIRLIGLRDPIDILGPNNAGLNPNTKIDGHRRAAAQQRNGQDTTRIRIPYDFRNAVWATILSVFIKINLNRRQLSLLGKARCYTNLYLGDRPICELDPRKEHELVAFLADALNMSAKNARRYARILRCPIELQQAVESGAVGMALAEKAADLTETESNALAAAIRDGEDPKEVVRRFLRKATKAARQKGQALAGFLGYLRKANAGFQGLKVTKSIVELNADEPAVLHETRRLIDEILRESEAKKKKFQATVENALATRRSGAELPA